MAARARARVFYFFIRQRRFDDDEDSDEDWASHRTDVVAYQNRGPAVSALFCQFFFYYFIYLFFSTRLIPNSILKPKPIRPSAEIVFRLIATAVWYRAYYLNVRILLITHGKKKIWQKKKTPYVLQRYAQRNGWHFVKRPNNNNDTLYCVEWPIFLLTTVLLYSRFQLTRIRFWETFYKKNV